MILSFHNHIFLQTPFTRLVREHAKNLAKVNRLNHANPQEVAREQVSKLRVAVEHNCSMGWKIISRPRLREPSTPSEWIRAIQCDCGRIYINSNRCSETNLSWQNLGEAYLLVFALNSKINKVGRNFHTSTVIFSLTSTLVDKIHSSLQDTTRGESKNDWNKNSDHSNDSRKREKLEEAVFWWFESLTQNNSRKPSMRTKMMEKRSQKA
jgi:hypothetical protein